MFNFKISKLLNNIIREILEINIPVFNFNRKKKLILRVVFYIHSFLWGKKTIIFQKKFKMNVKEIFFSMENKKISFKNIHEKISFNPLIPVSQNSPKIFFFKKNRLKGKRFLYSPKNFLKCKNNEEKQNKFFQMVNFFFLKKILLFYENGLKKLFNFKNSQMDLRNIIYFKKTLKFCLILLGFLSFSIQNSKTRVPEAIEKLLIFSNYLNNSRYLNKNLYKKTFFFKKKILIHRLNS
jgi:hypothetical protein|eukprot:Tamp_25497.p1 GENE.Tamp_25497~~Tamp_25497.p1  ORF type:complete len:237 (-),score=23.47 Tamp_25497:100-810(-)